jgi:hypothetical protein
MPSSAFSLEPARRCASPGRYVIRSPNRRRRRCPPFLRFSSENSLALSSSYPYQINFNPILISRPVPSTSV